MPPRRALSFDNNPSLSLPLRYFLTAPAALFAPAMAALLGSLLLFLGACYQPALARPAAALMCLACIGLWLNLCMAARLRQRMQSHG